MWFQLPSSFSVRECRVLSVMVAYSKGKELLESRLMWAILFDWRRRLKKDYIV